MLSVSQLMQMVVLHTASSPALTILWRIPSSWVRQAPTLSSFVDCLLVAAGPQSSSFQRCRASSTFFPSTPGSYPVSIFVSDPDPDLARILVFAQILTLTQLSTLCSGFHSNSLMAVRCHILADDNVNHSPVTLHPSCRWEISAPTHSFDP